MNYAEESLKKHYEWRGKVEMVSRVAVDTREALALAYTPGVAEPCLEIAREQGKSYALTRRWNTVAVITDGTAVLGLGDIGPEAAMPVMEGKAVLFKELAGIDAIPLCIRSKDTDEIVNTVRLLSGSFGGINLEDISAPRCFEIEKKLKEVCDIPIFHDDQHGTAIVVLAAVINSLKVVGKSAAGVSVVINGAGAAGTATARLLADYGIKNITLCDKQGALGGGGAREGASLTEVMRGANVFIGLSGPNCVTTEMVAAMNKDAIVLAMANPVPEIMPDAAKAGGAAIVGTGRSDFPNQINNVLAFPGVFRGVLDARAQSGSAANIQITEKMKIAAAKAIADYIRPTAENILPSPLDRGVAAAVATAVAAAYDKVFELPLAELQPSQLYISEGKLRLARSRFDSNNKSNFDPIPIKRYKGRYMMTDGHTRAALATLSGWETVPVTWDDDPLDMRVYAECVRWCDEAGIKCAVDLAERVITDNEYTRLWNKRCDDLKGELKSYEK